MLCTASPATKIHSLSRQALRRRKHRQNRSENSPISNMFITVTTVGGCLRAHAWDQANPTSWGALPKVIPVLAASPCSNAPQAPMPNRSEHQAEPSATMTRPEGLCRMSCSSHTMPDQARRLT